MCSAVFEGESVGYNVVLINNSESDIVVRWFIKPSAASNI